MPLRYQLEPPWFSTEPSETSRESQTSKGGEGGQKILACLEPKWHNAILSLVENLFIRRP